jgi:hypothetical protein
MVAPSHGSQPVWPDENVRDHTRRASRRLVAVTARQVDDELLDLLAVEHLPRVGSDAE